MNIILFLKAQPWLCKAPFIETETPLLETMLTFSALSQILVFSPEINLDTLPALPSTKFVNR
jgi:hypothetical protein